MVFVNANYTKNKYTVQHGCVCFQKHGCTQSVFFNNTDYHGYFLGEWGMWCWCDGKRGRCGGMEKSGTEGSARYRAQLLSVDGDALNDSDRAPPSFCFACACRSGASKTKEIKQQSTANNQQYNKSYECGLLAAVLRVLHI